MFRLDYISCVLTILSTILVGRRMWQGWIIAGANSLIICLIGFRTTQLGFIPANLFCLAIYAHNIVSWRNPLSSSKSTPQMQRANVIRLDNGQSFLGYTDFETTSSVSESAELLHQL
jgi:hypothetical protein